MSLCKLRAPGLAVSAGLLVLGFAAAGRGAELKSGKIDFNRDVRPILSDTCFTCHGPDENNRKAKLRFDLKEAAFLPAKSGARPIVPGHPAESELVKRITSADEDEVMPPPKAKKKLTPAQIEVLKRWIAEGATWQSHWAYETPKPPVEPDVKRKNWPRNAIDRFVLARLEKEGLKPAPEADRPTLIRRLSLDLTGLPPTPAEIDDYLQDRSPDAYERVVERLLKSPRYGEHQAKYWLDAARYADSHGFHIDSQRDIWAYREWVINAFNENKPYDQFTLEQLAGDLLPNPTTAQKIGSGYVRCNMSTGEGGAIEDEYKAKYTFDRVETTGTIWLGLTLVCARCHTHKYDPIAQQEYYRLYAFFNNLDESTMDGNKPNPDPFLKLPSPEQTARLEWLKQHLADGQQKLDAPLPELDRALEAWITKWNTRLNAGWTTLAPTTAASAVTNGATLRLLDDRSVLAEGANPENDTYDISAPLAAGRLGAVRLEALPHASLPHQASGRADDGGFRLSELEAEIVTLGAEGKSETNKLKFARAVADTAEGEREAEKAIDGDASTGWGVATNDVAQPHTAVFLLAAPRSVPEQAGLRMRLRFDGSKSRRALGHFRLAAAQADELVGRLHPPKIEPWQELGPLKSENLAAGFQKVYEAEEKVELGKVYPGVREEARWRARDDLLDGKSQLLVDELHGVHGVYFFHRKVNVPTERQVELSFRANDLFKVWVNGRLALERGTPAQVGEGPAKGLVTLQAGDNTYLIKVVNHTGAAYFAFDQDLRDPEALPAELAAILATTPHPTGAWPEKLRTYHHRQNSPEFKSRLEEVALWRDEQGAVERAIPTTMVAKERARDKMNESHLLMRGDYDKPGDVVTPGVPAILPPLPKDAPTNRLGLAQWLIDPAHPLTARVAVNRSWQQFFGIGLVKTAEDFGVQGERPSHPELLDWLAVEFSRKGWDVQRVQRLIVTSATYRQSAKAGRALWARDPENRLLARGPRFRVDGETLRDLALSVSGLLVEQRGGRSVKPYEPPGLWEAVSYNNAQKYVPDTGGAQYRRSLYTYWKRQSPPPNMLLFDAPTREYCVVRRPRTNTPLQALTLLNDPQFVESARAFAQRMLVEGGTTMDERLRFGFRLATGRAPAGDELRVLRGVLEQQLAEYGKDKAAAAALLAVGNFQARPGLEAGELAAWTTLAGLILNLDETVTKG